MKCVRKYRVFGYELGAFAGHLQHEADSIVTFLKYEGVEPTPNAVERALRPYVCRRKISFGQTSLHGEEDISNLLPLHETCRWNGRSTYDELKKAIECHARGRTPGFYWIRKAGMKCGARSPVELRTQPPCPASGHPLIKTSHPHRFAPITVTP